MPHIESLLMELDERNLARKVGLEHDNARISFPLHSNTVSSFDEFMQVIGEYYNYHFSRCVSYGGQCPGRRPPAGLGRQ